LEKIKKKIRRSKYIGVTFPKPEIISENLYPQIRKAVRSITELCEQHDFTILHAAYFVTKTSIYIILQPKATTLSKTVLHEGPPTLLKKNADEFLEKWMHNPRTQKKPFEKNKRLYVEINREYTDIKALLHNQVRCLNLGKHINNIIKEGYTIINRKDLLADHFRMFWTTHLDTQMPWEH
jgi:tRNA nucleotidyltransferase (CCA-adding enzyme)